jgi:hypothetical protein
VDGLREARLPAVLLRPALPARVAADGEVVTGRNALAIDATQESPEPPLTICGWLPGAGP